VLEQAERLDTEGDADWLLLASLSLGGAKVVSVPRTLARTTRSPGSAAADPIGSGATLAVVQAYERACPPALDGLPRLAASLAARRTGPSGRAPLATRVRWIWEHEGVAGFARRSSVEAGRFLRKARVHPGRVSDRARRKGREARGGEAAPRAG